MKTIRILASIWALTVALVAASSSRGAIPPPLPWVEQQVVEALLREEIEANLSPEQVVRDVASLRELRLTNTYEAFIESLRDEGQRRSPAFREAVEDMLTKNQSPATISMPTAAHKPVHLVPRATLQELLGSAQTNTWDQFYQRFPRSRQVIAVSRPGIDSKGEVAIVCFGIQDPWRLSLCQVDVLKREGKHWVLEVYRRSLGGPLYEGEMQTVICELRYYRTDGYGSLSTVNITGTNLTATVEEPTRLQQSTNGLTASDISGFVLQIIAPPEYAGQVVTAHFDGPLGSGNPFRAFTFGKRYQLRLSKRLIGERDFRLCY